MKFKDIPGWEGIYQIAKDGTVRRVGKHSQKKPLKHWLRCGYPAVTFVHLKRRRNYQIHTLVLMAWKRLPLLGEEVRHLDNNPLNCHIDNLEWGTSKENTNDMIKANRHGRQRACRNSCGEEFSSIANAARHYGVAYATVRLACAGRSKSCGLNWEYVT